MTCIIWPYCSDPNNNCKENIEEKEIPVSRFVQTGCRTFCRICSRLFGKRLWPDGEFFWKCSHVGGHGKRKCPIPWIFHRMGTKRRHALKSRHSYNWSRRAACFVRQPKTWAWVPTSTFATASAAASRCHPSHNASNKPLNPPLLAVERILNGCSTDSHQSHVPAGLASYNPCRESRMSVQSVRPVLPATARALTTDTRQQSRGFSFAAATREQWVLLRWFFRGPHHRQWTDSRAVAGALCVAVQAGKRRVGCQSETATETGEGRSTWRNSRQQTKPTPKPPRHLPTLHRPHPDAVRLLPV